MSQNRYDFIQTNNANQQCTNIHNISERTSSLSSLNHGVILPIMPSYTTSKLSFRRAVQIQCWSACPCMLYIRCTTARHPLATFCASHIGRMQIKLIQLLLQLGYLRLDPQTSILKLQSFNLIQQLWISKWGHFNVGLTMEVLSMNPTAATSCNVSLTCWLCTRAIEAYWNKCIYINAGTSCPVNSKLKYNLYTKY